jgi:NAD-dependent deacetylase
MSLNQEILQIFVNSTNICILTGAGISAESGIPTFRGQGGLWSKFKPEELAQIDAFLANPRLVWEWYQHRRDVLTNVKPNAAHFALADWERYSNNFTLITQNVDGLHQAAGSKNVLELHGNIRVNRCQRCGLESTMDEISYDGEIPLCGCGGMLRPGVVWFGETLPEDTLAKALHAAECCDLFVSIGTSAVVYPAASLPEIALERRVPVIEVNSAETPFTPVATYHLRGFAGQIVPQLVSAYAEAHQ